LGTKEVLINNVGPLVLNKRRQKCMKMENIRFIQIDKILEDLELKYSSYCLLKLQMKRLWCMKQFVDFEEGG
jgi:hypothetical protein